MTGRIKILTRVAISLALVSTAATAHAALHAIGHEFRPTVEERAGTNPCTDSNGVTAAVVFRCNEVSPGAGCLNPAVGKLYAEWRTVEGDLDADPVLIVEGYYSYNPPYSCSADGAIGLVLEPNLRVIDRQGVRGPGSQICGDGNCFGPAIRSNRPRWSR